MCDGYAGVDTWMLCTGVREPQTKALFDVRVVDTDAWSYNVCSPLMFWVLLRLRRSRNICRLVRTFTPLCVSVW